MNQFLQATKSDQLLLKKMDPNDEIDIDKLIQDELDALSLDESMDELPEDDQTDAKEIENGQVINERRQNLERQMHERLAAFEKEIQVNLDRCEIDYTEIDELLQKPIGNNEKDIQTNVARECGIDREELDRILQSISTEELPTDRTVQSDSNENEVPKIEPIKQSIETVDTVESVEPTPREQEDPNKKIHDERLAESHRRMLDELALLEQRRQEEEERYAIVLQEQQARLAEEYRRLKESHAESTRQTQNERLQFEALCREQERVANERQTKMAIIIQSWYRGQRIYHQYHEEIMKRAAPTLKSIAKKRKKKEQIELANATKPVDITEKENQQITFIPPPSSNRISSPLAEVTTKQASKVHKTPPLSMTENITSNEDSTKKKKITSKQTSNTSLLSTQILQMENPADFIPTIFPEETRPKSSNKRQHLAKIEPAHEHILTTKRLKMIPIKSNNTHSLSRTKVVSTTITRSNTFDKNIEIPLSPSIENLSLVDSIIRSKTFDIQMENFSTPSMENLSREKSIEIISSISRNRSETFVNKSERASPLPPIESTLSMSTIEARPTSLKNPSNGLITKSDNGPAPPIKPIEIIPTSMENQSEPASAPMSESIPPLKPNETIPTLVENQLDKLSSKPKRAPTPIESITSVKSNNIKENKSEVFINGSTTVSASVETIPAIKSIDISTSIKPIPPSTPRVSTPRKVPVQEKQPVQANYSYLNDARRWAEHTRDITYANLIRSSKEILQQMSIRKTGVTLRKLADIDPQILTKAIKNQSPKEIRYLLLEQLLTPYSLSLIGTMFPNLTHLTLRQCKFIQLTGLESCSSLNILDIEGNWLEQIHIQNNHLKYLNISRNRITSLLSLQTPQLKYLDVSKNRLTRLNGIETLANLNILLATSNQLLTTIGLQGCTHLLHIDVSDNHLVEMEQLDQCPLLITIKASSNALIQIPYLENSILLNELDLSSNSLTSLEESSIGSWLPFLTHLHLSSNSLQELSSIKLPSLVELNLAFNQLSDVSTVQHFIKPCRFLSRINLEQNPVVCDIKDPLVTEKKSVSKSLSVLPQSSSDKSSESIHLYLEYLSNMTSMLMKLRRMIEQYQVEPFDLLKSIQHQCQIYYEQKRIEPAEVYKVVFATPETKVSTPTEQSIIRLQAHYRRRLVERQLIRNQQAAQKIQACWRGYAVRRRMRTVRRLFSQQQQQTFDEIDLTQFDFDEAAFDARFQRPHTPVNRIRHVWQSQNMILPKPPLITDVPRPSSSRSSSAASSRAKPIIESLDMSTQPQQIANEWGFTPSSSTAALMLKRAQKMKWNAERRHKRQHMDAYQRLQMARNNEQPPGSLRLARRHQSLTNTSKPIAQKKTVSPPSNFQSRPNRVYEWVHTQVARFDDSALGNNNNNSPRYERKRLPSLDGSTDSTNRIHPNGIVQPQNRWASPTTTSIRQPPPLLPPIIGQLPRL